MRLPARATGSRRQSSTHASAVYEVVSSGWSTARSSSSGDGWATHGSPALGVSPGPGPHGAERPTLAGRTASAWPVRCCGSSLTAMPIMKRPAARPSPDPPQRRPLVAPSSVGVAAAPKRDVSHPGSSRHPWVHGSCAHSGWSPSSPALMAAACDGGVTAPTTIAPATPTTPVAPTTTTTTTPADERPPPRHRSRRHRHRPGLDCRRDVGRTRAASPTPCAADRRDAPQRQARRRSRPASGAGGAEPLVDAVRRPAPTSWPALDAAIDIEPRAWPSPRQALADDEPARRLPLSGRDHRRSTPTTRPPIRSADRRRAGSTTARTRLDGDDRRARRCGRSPPLVDSTCSFAAPTPSDGRSLHANFFVRRRPIGRSTAPCRGPTGPSTTGDDPAAWLPELLLGSPGSGRPVPRRVGWPATPSTTSAGIAARGRRAAPSDHRSSTRSSSIDHLPRHPIEQPDPDRIAFAYRADYDRGHRRRRPIGTLSHPGVRHARARRLTAAAATAAGAAWTARSRSPASPWAPTVARSSRTPDDDRLRQQALQRRAGGADDVQRAGDEHGVVAVGAAHRAASQASLDGVGGEHLVAAERDRGARPPPAPGMPRGDGAVQATTTSNSSARSASSISTGRAPAGMPTTRIRRPSGSKSSKNTWRARVGAGRVVGAVDDHQRLVAEHLEAPGHHDGGEALARRRPRRAARRRTPRPRSARRRRCRPGGAPCSGTNTSG